MVNGPPYLLLPRSIRGGISLLPVGEGTASLRALVLPGILEHFIDCGEGIVTSWLNSEVLLEFISAQAPLKMKGSLICLWYALSALRYLTQAASIYFTYKEEVWLIYTGVKASLMLLSILLYCCVAKRYCYRLRDEVVNERYLVEEVYDRELRQAEQYEREKSDEIRALYETVNAQRYQSIDSSTISKLVILSF